MRVRGYQDRGGSPGLCTVENGTQRHHAGRHRHHPVEKHGKKGNKIIELKQHIPQVAYTAEGDAVRIELCLPASQELNLNPSLLTGFLEEKFGLPAASAGILRTKFLTEDKQLFA